MKDAGGGVKFGESENQRIYKYLSFFLWLSRMFFKDESNEVEISDEVTTKNEQYNKGGINQVKQQRSNKAIKS